jgi:RNA polymerase sigma factor (sigma-70 family)
MCSEVETGIPTTFLRAESPNCGVEFPVCLGFGTCPVYLPAMEADALNEWFKREVLVHEAALTAYLRRNWPRAADIHDLRQEVYVRIYESARSRIPDVVRPFIFTIARNLMADHIRRQRVVAIDSRGDLGALNILVDDRSPEHRAGAHQELRRLAEALDGLPDKCREVLWLRRIDNLSQKEVAQRLGLSEKTVENHVMRGMKRLTDEVFGGYEPRAAGAPAGEKDREHGQQAD